MGMKLTRSDEALKYLDYIINTEPHWKNFPESHPVIKKLRYLFESEVSIQGKSTFRIRLSNGKDEFVFDSVRECANVMKCSTNDIYTAMSRGGRVKGYDINKIAKR